jgi:6-phosphogluconolactonase
MGDAHGISLLEHDRDGGRLIDLGLRAVTESPSYLVERDEVIYAVNEANEGRVTSFRWRPEERSLQLLDVQSTGGAEPCHLAVHPDDGWLAAANYTSGSVSLHRLGPGGRIEPRHRLIELTGAGPVLDRQDHAHAHQVVFAGTELFIVDLGSDRVWRYHFEVTDGRVTAADPLVLPPGFGPRQLLLTPDLAYVLGELSNAIARFARAGGPAQQVSPAFAAPLPEGNLAAALVAEAGTGTLLVSHRGADRISELEPDRLTVRREWPSGGHGPRQLAVADGYLYAANQLSGSVSCWAPGRAEAPVSVATPTPTCVLPLDD